MPQPHIHLLAAVALSLAAVAPAGADNARPVLNAPPGCEGGVTDAYNTGYLDGVEAVKAQLAQSTAVMQSQVQDQLNAQLAQMQAQSAAELDTRIAAAQDKALSEQTGIPPEARMPSLSGTIQALDKRVASAGTQRETRPNAVAHTNDPATLPPGTTITIRDPQRLPPDLYRSLMDYVGS